MPRKLYKQPPSFRSCVESKVLSALSLPASVHSALLSCGHNCSTIPCLDLILKWVVLIEATSKIGVSGRRQDILRATHGLYNLLAGGARTRLRNPKRGRLLGGSEVPTQQAERGLETVRRVIEAYFVDDMCHLFETEPFGDLYEKVQQVDEDIALGHETIQSIVAATERCVYTRHVSVVPILAFVMYVSEQIVTSANGRHGGDHGREVWNVQGIHDYCIRFCRQVLKYCGGQGGYGCLPDYSADESAYSVVLRLSKYDLSLCRIAHGISVVSAVVSAASSANDRMKGGESCMKAVHEVCNGKEVGGSHLSALKASIRRIMSAPNEKATVPLSEAEEIISASLLLRDVTEPSLMPSFGIIGCSKYIREKLREKDFYEYHRPSQALQEAYNSIRSDFGTFSNIRLRENVQNEAHLLGEDIPGPLSTSAAPSSCQLPGFSHLQHFLDSCILLATALAEECHDLLKRQEISSFEEFKNDTIRMIILGCVGSDLEGFLTVLYEEYALKEIISGFEEETGARNSRSSRTAGRRERSPKPSDGRTRKARMLKAERTESVPDFASPGE